MITYGVNTFMWASPFRTRDLPLLDKTKSLGFDLMEIPIEGEQDIDYRAAAESYKRAGLKCSICAVMGAGRDPSHDDESIQKGGVSYLKHLIDAAVIMGSPIVVGPLYAAVGRTWQATADQRRRELDRCAKNLKQVARHAEDKGITLALEPLNRFETSFINLTEQALELVGMIDSPRVKLMMDTFHANIEEKSLGRAIEAAGPLMVHLHANENDRGAPGTGHVTWNEIAAALKKVKFAGALVIESFSTEVKEIARAAAVWRPLASSPEALARDGLAFLKKLMT
ncbi:MAG TPA: sugar phosphate isomerase/epimerase family protein [Spirochaetia bacterium]|nr:sugar phosphate isomerase/epimerase family protein [Spirochaetia bacterium]